MRALGWAKVTKPETAPERLARVRFKAKNGYTVAVTDQPITLESINAALAEFP
jgi:hypothetical protein